PEIQEAAFDVSEVHAEDLLAGSEITNHIEDLFAGLFELLRHRALAEIETVIGTLFDRNKSLQSIRRSQHRVDAAPSCTLRHTRVLRMTTHANLVLIRHRHHTLEKIRDSLPVGIRVDFTRDRQRWILLRGRVDEFAIP